LYFGDLQVPVAVFIPDEPVDGTGNVVEAVIGEAFADFCLGSLQLADDPAVGLGKIKIAPRAAILGGMFLETAVLAFAVHQHESAGVPQFVAEVAVAFAAAQVEIEGSREGGKRSESEPERIGAKGWNTVRIVSAHVLFNLLPVIGTQQPHR